MACGGLRLLFTPAIGKVEAEENACTAEGRFHRIHHLKHYLANLLNNFGPSAKSPHATSDQYKSLPFPFLLYTAEENTTHHVQEMTLLLQKKKLKLLGWNSHNPLLFSLSSPNIFIHTHSYLLLGDIVEEDPMCSSSSGPLHHQFSPHPCVATLPISTGFLPSTYA